MSSYRTLLSNSKNRRGSSYLFDANSISDQKLPPIGENAKEGNSEASTTTASTTAAAAKLILPPIVLTPRSETSTNTASNASVPRKNSLSSMSPPALSPRLLLVASESVPNIKPDSQTALSDFLKAKSSATSGTAPEFHVGGTEAIISGYCVPILEEAELIHWR